MHNISDVYSKNSTYIHNKDSYELREGEEIRAKAIHGARVAECAQ
jgi:DNA-directed RNA polymerase subunit E'/Rpb7